MSPFKDLLRVLNGVALVTREAARRSDVLEAARTRDLEALVSHTLKKAIVSATDLAGLTKGRSREVSSPRVKESVVYFSDPPEPATTSRSDAEEELVQVFQSNREVSTSVDVIELKETIAVVHLEDSGGTSEKKDVIVADGVAAAAASASTDVPVKQRQRRERRVPSTPFSRALGFAGLGAGLAWGTVQEYSRRLVYGTPKLEENKSALSPFLSEQNAERLAVALCRMRGAALKLGQMLSIQDESLVPEPILKALEIVRQGADVMPRTQLNGVLNAELGLDWPSKLKSFDYEPLAAASIGQVHRAVMKDGLEVALKIQYPGVADSIESDIENVRRLLDYTNLIPKGLFLDQAIKVAKEELSRECDYLLEATNQKQFRVLVSDTEGFYVPMVIDELSSRKVLTTELVSGVPIDKVALLNQRTRDYVGRKLLELTLKELFVFRFMQTDPNWSNFLFDDATKMINLIDFGAAREYPQHFVDDYLQMVMACANRDRDRVLEMSRRLGFLTGEESDVMMDAHVQAGFIVGLPFSEPGGYDFSSTNITQSISNLGATMLRHRLTPPPDEAYSLHRKLSGAFLACIKLRAVVPCREVLFQVFEQYQLSGESSEIVQSSLAS